VALVVSDCGGHIIIKGSRIFFRHTSLPGCERNQSLHPGFSFEKK
jgi:hypothetical protein